MYGNSSARLAETLQAGHQPLSVQLCALADHESRLEQAQRVNEMRCVQRKLKGDRATKGMPDNVRTPYTEIRQQPPTVAGLLRETRWPTGAAAATVAATVISDEPIAVGQPALPQKRSERVGNERAVDTNHRLTGAAVLVLQHVAPVLRRSGQATIF